jgi:hypothetical protein
VGSLPTEAVGFFLLEKSTACSTIRYKRHKRQLKVQYQDNEAQDMAKKKKAVGFLIIEKSTARSISSNTRTIPD